MTTVTDHDVSRIIADLKRHRVELEKKGSDLILSIDSQLSEIELSLGRNAKEIETDIASAATEIERLAQNLED